MEKEITFRTEVEFKGSAEEFAKVAEALVKLPVRLRVEWPPGHLAGCWPVGIEKLLGRPALNRIAEGMPRLKIVKGIDGGMRDPHFHLGDEIVLLSRERFRELVGKAAMEIAGIFADKAEYAQAIGTIRSMVNQCEAIPINIP